MLTKALQDSIGGDSRTLMFVNFSPSPYNQDETNCALKYAEDVKKIESKVDFDGAQVVIRRRVKTFALRQNLKVWRKDLSRIQKRSAIMKRWEWLLQILGVLVLRYIGQIPADAPRWHRRRRDLFVIRTVDESTERPLKAIAAARVVFNALKKCSSRKS